MKHITVATVLLLAGCAAKPIASSSNTAQSHISTEDTYITGVLHPNGLSALPMDPPGSLERLVVPKELTIAPGRYTISGGCSHVKDAGPLPISVTLAPGRRYILSCSKSPLRLLIRLAPNNSFKPKPLRGSA